jgi:ribosome-associated translation inhibitor RaiA
MSDVRAKHCTRGADRLGGVGAGFAVIIDMPHTHPNAIAIHVVGDAAIPQQTKNYAEYRVFAVVTKHHLRPQSVRLTLRSIEPENECRFCECETTLTMHDGRIMSVSVRGAHPYAAVNRAIDRIDIALSEEREKPAPVFAES